MVSIHLENIAASKQNSFSFTKRYRYIAIGILLGLFLFYLFKSCSLNNSSTDYYIIEQDTRWKDMHLTGKERNLAAFNNELLTTIAKQEHFRIRLTVSSELMKELEEKKVQGILTNLQPSYLNENLLFSEPFFLVGPVLIISAYASKQDEKGKKVIIGISDNSPLFSSLQQDPSIEVKIYESILPALEDLRYRRIDGAIFPAIPAYTYTQTFYKQELKIATLPLMNEGIRLVTLKNQTGESLIEKFNEGLEALRNDGTYHKMLHRWGLIDTEQVES